MMKYVWAAVAILTLGLATSTIWTAKANARLATDLQATQASLAAVEQQRDDLVRASRIAAQQAAEWQERAQTLDAAVEELLTGGIEDALLDPGLAAIVNGLRTAADDIPASDGP